MNEGLLKENAELKRKLNAAIEVIGDHEDKSARLERVIAESKYVKRINISEYDAAQAGYKAMIEASKEKI